ncbi:MAG: sulfite oxidase heme-binding subunit YedZ [Steroidobacterales bacterium]
MACLVPFLGCLGGVLQSSGVPYARGFDLGADPVRYVLGVFGHSALNLLLITLCVTPLRQLSGNANLIRLRRMLGLFAFTYALLHFLTYVGPFQGLSLTAIIKDITAKRWYIIIGFSALLLLIPLAVTSTNKMMRRLGRRWQKLHRLIYLITALGVWHYWSSIKKDYREPLLYAALLSVLLGWRIWKRYAAMAKTGAAPTTGAASIDATSRSAPPTAPEKT